VRGSERDRDEVQERRDAEGDLSEGGGGGPRRPALRDAGEGVGAETKNGAAGDDVLRDKGSERRNGLKCQ